MAKKSKIVTSAETLVAASPILIEGKHFDRGQEIEGVSAGELRKAVSVRRVVKASELAARAAPETPADPEPEEQASTGEPEEA